MKKTAQEKADAVRLCIAEINGLLQECNDIGVKVEVSQKWNAMTTPANGLPINAPLSVTISQSISL